MDGKPVDMKAAMLVDWWDEMRASTTVENWDGLMAENLAVSKALKMAV